MSSRDNSRRNRRRGDALLQFRYQLRLGSFLLVVALLVELIIVNRTDEHNTLTQIILLACILLTAFLIFLHQWWISRLLKERVTEKEKYLSSVLASSVDGIIFIDNDNRVVSWNQGAEMIFGYTADEMIGQTFHRLIPPGVDADRELSRIKEAVESVGFIRHYRGPRITKGGKRITIDLSRTMVHSEKGAPLGSTAIVRDITDKEEMDKQIYNAEKLASLGTLAAGVAHEINNPLAVILGFTDLLREKFPAGSPEYKDLELIEENANNARRIVESMLGFARITEGLEDVVDIEKGIQRVVDIVQLTHKRDDISMVIDVADNLPRVRGDVREFQQVLFNLINNAMAAMADTGGVLGLVAETDGDRVLIKISDTGSGIPEEIKGQIFDPFFTTKKVGEGTGLGLSLCYGIIKKYGGRIDFTSVARVDGSDQPSGTTFTISLPAIKPEQQLQGDS